MPYVFSDFYMNKIKASIKGKYDEISYNKEFDRLYHSLLLQYKDDVDKIKQSYKSGKPLTAKELLLIYLTKVDGMKVL